MKKNNKSNKFKWAGLVTLITGGLVAGSVSFTNKTSTPDEAKQEVTADTTMSIEQIEWLIQQTDATMTTLKKKIDSEKTNPEERFEARRAYQEIASNRDTLVKKLKIAKSKQTKDSIEFNKNQQITR